LSLIQRLITRFAPRRAAEIERESREWLVTCTNCGHATSYWDLGGVRYKAASTGKRTLIRCPKCNERVMGRVERRRTPAGELPQGQ
jgi:DNA-directed RNA polymerase subunit RPC12/RpoP